MNERHVPLQVNEKNEVTSVGVLEFTAAATALLSSFRKECLLLESYFDDDRQVDLDEGDLRPLFEVNRRAGVLLGVKDGS